MASPSPSRLLVGALLISSERNWTQNVLSTIANVLAHMTEKSRRYTQLQVVLGPGTHILSSGLEHSPSLSSPFLPGPMWFSQQFLDYTILSAVSANSKRSSPFQSFRKCPGWAWLSLDWIGAHAHSWAKHCDLNDKISGLARPRARGVINPAWTTVSSTRKGGWIGLQRIFRMSPE